jgi:protein gp37
MSVDSNIEWTDSTWNPARGCTKVSPGCAYCYAQTFAERFRGVPGHPFKQGFDVRLVPEKMAEPLRWKTPRRVFVNSMSDFVHERIPDGYIVQATRIMEAANWHTFQVLTKRPGRLQQMLKTQLSFAPQLAHIWWGVTVEDRRFGLPRIDILRDSPAALRFLSIEPLLEDLDDIDLTGIGWVIVGGESGAGARPMQAAWVLRIRDQCRAAGIPFFFKQWGGLHKKANGRLLEGRTFDEMPARLIRPVASDRDRRATIAQVEGWIAEHPADCRLLPCISGSESKTG